VLAGIGGVLGLIFAFWGVRALKGLAPNDVPRLDEAGLDLVTVAFALGATALSSIVFGMASVVSGVMRASGTVLVPMAISVLCIVAIEVPAAYVLSAHIGLEGVWWSYPIAFTSMLLLQSAFYRGVWRKKRIERLV